MTTKYVLSLWCEYEADDEKEAVTMADEALAALEASGLRCWRDIPEEDGE